MATSGLLVFAKGARMQRALSQAFQNRETTKYYRAAVIGQPALTSNDWQTIEAPLIVDWPNRPKSKVCFETGKASTTHWRVSASALAPQGRLADWRPGTEWPMTAVDLHPITGRSHQLRVHLASVGFPIAGDALYGPTDNATRAPRLLLHATQLALTCPRTWERLEWDCPAPF